MQVLIGNMSTTYFILIYLCHNLAIFAVISATTSNLSSSANCTDLLLLPRHLGHPVVFVASSYISSPVLGVVSLTCYRRRTCDLKCAYIKYDFAIITTNHGRVSQVLYKRKFHYSLLWNWKRCGVVNNKLQMRNSHKNRTLLLHN